MAAGTRVCGWQPGPRCAVRWQPGPGCAAAGCQMAAGTRVGGQKGGGRECGGIARVRGVDVDGAAWWAARVRLGRADGARFAGRFKHNPLPLNNSMVQPGRHGLSRRATTDPGLWGGWSGLFHRVLFLVLGTCVPAWVHLNLVVGLRMKSPAYCNMAN